MQVDDPGWCRVVAITHRKCGTLLIRQGLGSYPLAGEGCSIEQATRHSGLLCVIADTTLGLAIVEVKQTFRP